ncbi:response regulator [Alloacidobacterium sp.]|uniref:response regulator n=1 Tax=Alloacidobacterium sp. TaxID=2951999 RepID=UPI002D2DAF11|nr:response regulator [Alloacidobacterium sp.]HYK35009.1 response regulator [Alloacidobacterium sp.]
MPGVVRPSKVLIVDDEQQISDSLGQIFSSRGYEVWVTYSAEQAIDVIAQWQPDLAILDVMLPQMNGIDLAIVMKSNYPSCQFLLFSGHPGTAQVAEEAAKKGHVFDILTKPVPPALLLEAAANMLSISPALTENMKELEIPQAVTSYTDVIGDASIGSESSAMPQQAVNICLQLAELRLSLCFTFCAVAETELRNGQRVRAENLVQKLRQTAQSVRLQVDEHNLLTEDLRANVDAKLAQLDQKVLDIERRLAN